MNLYITKANEAWLRSKSNMSGIVNVLIEKERGVTPLEVAQEGFKEALDEWPKKSIPTAPPVVGSVSLGNDGGTVKKRLPSVIGVKVCKHGFDPKFCKFAKKGVCK